MNEVLSYVIHNFSAGRYRKYLAKKLLEERYLNAIALVAIITSTRAKINRCRYFLSSSNWCCIEVSLKITFSSKYCINRSLSHFNTILRAIALDSYKIKAQCYRASTYSYSNRATFPRMLTFEYEIYILNNYRFYLVFDPHCLCL